MRTVRAQSSNFSPSHHSLYSCFILLELTFIILARPLESIPSEVRVELTNEDIKALPMVGDVNLFFKNPRDDPEFEVECEVMIAGACPHSTSSTIRSSLTGRQMRYTLFYFPISPTEPAYRGQRRAHAALVLLLSYACDKLGIRKESFVARIGSANMRSIALFASLGFEVVRTVSVFEQAEMRVAECVVAQSWPAGHGSVREYS